MPTPADRPPLTIADWRSAYAAGASPRRLLTELRERLANEAPPGVWISVVSADALERRIEAIEADAASAVDDVARAARRPLHGVPFAVKDNIDVAGFDTTAACPAFARRAQADANAVARLLAAGAVCVGKTNLDQFATGLVGTRSPYGRPASTFAADRISGGSSSGSAVAVSRGDVPFALGTDTAGSGRVPAGFNHVVGLKPTPGRVGTRGVVPACRSLDCVSVFALTVDDAAAVLACIEGPDGDDAWSAFVAGPARFGSALRIGIPAQAAFSGDAGYADAFAAAVSRLERLGHRPIPVDFAPLHATAALLYEGPWVAERHTLVEALLDSRPEAFDPAVRQVIGRARSISATDAFRGQHALRENAHGAAAVWRQVDLLMVPTAPGHPRFAEVDADPLGANGELGLYTNFVNLLGWCALALPSGLTARGLPFGVTFIAPAAHDAALARFGRGWQRDAAQPLGATTAKPRVDDADADTDAWPAAAPEVEVAVVGAHLSGLPLHAQLVERAARLVATTRTAPRYRLHALPGTTPPKPGLRRVASGGASIAVEVWAMPSAAFGSFVAGVPAPLCIGSVELESGRSVHGFLCEPHALEGAEDISAHGGWKAWLASRGAASSAMSP